MSHKFSLKEFLSVGVVVTTMAVTSIGAIAHDYIGKGTVTGSVVNIRSEATTQSNVVGTAKQGTEYNVISKNNGWAKVETPSGLIGYMNLGYISVAEGKRMSVTVTGSAVNVREGAGTDFPIMGMAYKGQEYPVVGKENGWYKISFDNTNGYISSEYATYNALNSVNVPAGQKIVDYANQFLGKPYVYGAAGPNAFDCSGFTSYVYKEFGYSLNRTAAGQNSNGTWVAKENLQAGDLVMFSYRGGSGIGHVGIYIGNGKMIHAENSSTGVVISDVFSGYYGARYTGARRIV